MSRTIYCAGPANKRAAFLQSNPWVAPVWLLETPWTRSARSRRVFSEPVAGEEAARTTKAAVRTTSARFQEMGLKRGEDRPSGP